MTNHEAKVLDAAIDRHVKRIRWCGKRLAKLDRVAARKALYGAAYRIEDLLDGLDEK